MTVTEPGLYDNLTNAQYHADPVPAGSLSSSGARKLTAMTPAHYKWDSDHPVHKDIFDIGTAAHSLVLEGDNTNIEVLDFEAFTTKAAREARDAARAAGKTPLLRKDYETVQAMAEQIKANKWAMHLMADGRPEISAFWQHETGVWLRARFDWLPNHRGPGLLLIDYKTAVSADREKFAKSAADYGYHQQAAWYIDAAKALGLSDDPGFAFIVQEKTAPYLVNVVELEAEDIELGRQQNDKAIRLYKECTEAGNWPGYQIGEPVSLPKYARYQIEERLAA